MCARGHKISRYARTEHTRLPSRASVSLKRTSCRYGDTWVGDLRNTHDAGTAWEDTDPRVQAPPATRKEGPRHRARRLTTVKLPDNSIGRIPLRARDGSIRAYDLSDRGYARRNVRDGKVRTIRMQREIMGVVDDPAVVVDHVGRDKLDNRKSQLRVTTQVVNCRNRTPNAGAASKHRGVTRDGQGWMARAMLNRVSHYLGRFATEEEAAAKAAEFWSVHA